MSDKPQTDDLLRNPGNYTDDVLQDLGAAASDISRKQMFFPEVSWEKARALVADFHPVPSFLRPMIGNVFSTRRGTQRLHPMSFFALHPLIIRAAMDQTFIDYPAEGHEYTGQAGESSTIDRALSLVGDDVAAALCFIHAVCRRVDYVLPKRISIPILDDALIRAKLGFYLGLTSRKFGRGEGMLAGFAGRCGLAIQIAAGDLEEVQGVLESLAVGEDIQRVGERIYGCEPLQVSALTMIAAGCGREAAEGTSTFGYQADLPLVSMDEIKARWYAAFCIIEHMRMGRKALIHDSYWDAVDVTEVKQKLLIEKFMELQRGGHRWRWLTQGTTNG